MSWIELSWITSIEFRFVLCSYLTGGLFSGSSCGQQYNFFF